jgi:hypothetical protein
MAGRAELRTTASSDPCRVNGITVSPGSVLVVSEDGGKRRSMKCSRKRVDAMAV